MGGRTYSTSRRCGSFLKIMTGRVHPVGTAIRNHSTRTNTTVVLVVCHAWHSNKYHIPNLSTMTRLVTAFLIHFIMLSVTRAFSTQCFATRRPFLGVMVRSMTASGAPDTSVVATCTRKIQEALESNQVKVTGAYISYLYLCTWLCIIPGSTQTVSLWIILVPLLERLLDTQTYLYVHPFYHGRSLRWPKRISYLDWSSFDSVWRKESHAKTAIGVQGYLGRNARASSCRGFHGMQNSKWSMIPVYHMDIIISR